MEKPEKCSICAKRRKEEKESEEYNFAILLSLVPLMVFTFFAQLGLF